MRTTPRPGFVETPSVAEVTERAMAYIDAGFPVHFRGPAGVGKTTMAMHVAHKLGRPVMLMVGDDEFGPSDLVGSQAGYRRSRVVDNFISSVRKTEDDVAPRWVDNRLTIAAREGLTLVYDEFTRSRPEANNALLSVLEEGVLVLPPTRSRSGAEYLRVHPDFTAIFTSNPVEYAGVHQAQDALFERMVTIDLQAFNEESEAAIVRARTGVPEAEARTIVRVVRAAREALAADTQTVRSAIVIGSVLAQRGGAARAGDPLFEQTCQDVIASEAGRRGWNGLSPDLIRSRVVELIQQQAGGPAQQGRAAAKAGRP